jgi:tetratricopeptide (TPR) repeat protein
MQTMPEAFAAAMRHYRAQQFEIAMQICQQIIAVDSEHADALNLLGILTSLEGDQEAAARYIRRAIAQMGTNAAFHNNLGTVLKSQGKINEAIVCWQQAIEMDSNHVEAHYNLGKAFQALGQLAEAVVSYRRVLAIRPHFAEALTSLGTALQRQGKMSEAVASYLRALELKPDFALAHSNLGSALQVQGRWEEAAASCRRALELRPDFAAAHNNLGQALHAQAKLDEAVESYRHAIQLNSDLPEVHNNLGNALNDQGKTHEAEKCCRRALELKPDYAEAHNNLGNVQQQLGQFDAARGSYARAATLNPNLVYAHYGQATLELLTGNWTSGWEEYEWRLQTQDYGPRHFTQPRWDGSPLGRRTILLHCEQGLGDTIQFVRYAAQVKGQNPGATIILECQQPLIKMLSGYAGIDRLVGKGDELPPFDFQIPLLSLPGALGTSPETVPRVVPYLTADPILVDKWREKLALARGLRIGINWRGRSLTRRRDIPFVCFQSLAERPNVCLISLQKGEARPDENVGNHRGIIDLGNDFDSTNGPFMDTAAVMMNLDLVISSDTAVPHLAGALGVPVWLALPFVPDWRWLLDRTDSPWYPTMRLFRQRTVGNWDGVFQEIRAEVGNLVHES